MRPALSIALAISASASAAGLYPELDMHGVRYESACIYTNWKATQELLVSASKGKNPSGLLNLVKTWLCDSGPRADQILRRSAATKIQLTSQQTGIIGQKHSHIPPSSVRALGGKVWDVDVERATNKVSVKYYPNEACAASGTFAHRNGQWRLITVSEACD
jgi:hypothetical protein